MSALASMKYRGFIISSQCAHSIYLSILNLCKIPNCLVALNISICVFPFVSKVKIEHKAASNVFTQKYNLLPYVDFELQHVVLYGRISK